VGVRKYIFFVVNSALWFLHSVCVYVFLCVCMCVCVCACVHVCMRVFFFSVKCQFLCHTNTRDDTMRLTASHYYSLSFFLPARLIFFCLIFTLYLEKKRSFVGEEASVPSRVSRLFLACASRTQFFLPFLLLVYVRRVCCRKCWTIERSNFSPRGRLCMARI